MKVNVIAVILIAALVVPASAGYLTVKAAGDNPNFRIFVNDQEVRIYPDGSSNVIKVESTAVVSVICPNGIFTEEIITRGNTVYQTPHGAVVSPGKVETLPTITPSSPSTPPTPTPVITPAPTPTEKPKDNNSDGSKHPKRNK